MPTEIIDHFDEFTDYLDFDEIYVGMKIRIEAGESFVEGVVTRVVGSSEFTVKHDGWRYDGNPCIEIFHGEEDFDYYELLEDGRFIKGLPALLREIGEANQ